MTEFLLAQNLKAENHQDAQFISNLIQWFAS